KLLSSRISVLKYRMSGSSKCPQSLAAPCRITMALVRAANIIQMAASATQIPVCEGLTAAGKVETGAGRPCWKPPPPSPVGPKSRSMPGGGAEVVDAIVSPPRSDRSACRNFFGRDLHYVIAAGTFHTVFLWAMMDHKMPPAEVVTRRLRSRCPLQRGRFTGIVSGFQAT